ncbi:MAG: bestrophin family protein [Gemmatimonadaceae bacterium]|nr:bestrophin family protein [Gemmatimonadaceae bacterium]
MISYDPKNWLRILFDFPRSPIFRTLFLDVLGAGAWAALVVWIETDVFRVAVPLGPSFLSILGIILGLLLVFRTNTAYDRWWEGRKLWGQLVNISRGLSRQLSMAPAERRSRYADLLAEFPPALAAHLRRERGAPGPHVPNRILSELHAEVRVDAEAGRLATDARLVTAPLLQGFDDVLGACERIRNTPIPFSYSSYVKQFVVLYALVMPFGLVQEFGYGTIIASMFTFFATMGLELLAGEVEEPFGTDRNDLPLEEISAVIVRDVRGILTP